MARRRAKPITRSPTESSGYYSQDETLTCPHCHNSLGELQVMHEREMERMKAAHALSKEKNEKLRVNLDYNIGEKIRLEKDLEELSCEKDELENNLISAKTKLASEKKNIDGLLDIIGDYREKLKIKEEEEMEYKQKISCQLRKIQQECDDLKEAINRLFRRGHPTVCNWQKIMFGCPAASDPDLWRELMGVLDMERRGDFCANLSKDPKENLNHVFTSWINGNGAGPRTWGKLLDSIEERGSSSLRQVGCQIQHCFLRELICLELPFSVCTICGKTISKDDGEDSNFNLSLIHPEEVVTTGKDAIVTQPELKEISTTDI